MRSRLEPLLRYLGALAGRLKRTPRRAAGTARRVTDPARQVVDYFLSERATVRQGFVAVSIAGMTSLIAGVTLAGMEERLSDVPGLLVLIPVSIGMRGNIFGSLAARLGTSIHSGLFEVSRERASALYQNVFAAALLTVVTSVAMGLLGRGMLGLLGLESVSVFELVVITLVGGLLSSAVVLAVTIYLSVESFRRGWDLDSVGAPLITAMGDAVTLPFLFLSSFLIDVPVLVPVVGIAGIAVAAIALVRGYTEPREITRRIVHESFPVLCVAILLDLLAGAVVGPRAEAVFAQFAGLFIILPSFLEVTGALGGILAARLGSKLHLGIVVPRARPEPVALLDASIILVLGLTVYGLTSVASLPLAEALGTAYPGVLRTLALTMTAGLLATLLASLIGYYAAVATYRFGLDPDNQTIPIVTSGMDLLGVICLVVSLAVFQVA